MGKKRLCAAVLTLVVLLLNVVSLAPAVSAASETVQSGDKVAITGAEGHQYYYYTADGTIGYCWASYMCVAVSELFAFCMLIIAVIKLVKSFYDKK